MCIAFLGLNEVVAPEIMANGIMLIPYCFLIWALAQTRSTFLASRPLQIGGEISYGVYILQMPFAHVLFLARRLTGGAFHSVLWMLLLYPTAWLTYVAIEKTCRALLLHRRPSRDDKPIPTPQAQLP